MKLRLGRSKKTVISIGVLLVLVLALIVVGILAIIANSSERKLAEQLELGQKYLDELAYEQAIVAYETAIEIDPKCEEAYLALAEAYLQMGEHDKAMECASQGYSQTGSEKLLGKMEELQDLMNALLQNEGRGSELSSDDSENGDSSDISEEEAAYGERIVDGIYHHGYAFYDLTGEEETLLDELISYTETGKYEEYAVMLNDKEEYVQAYLELSNKYETNYKIHIAYSGYKILVKGGSGVCLIPIEDGIGAWYQCCHRQSDSEYWGDGSFRYTYFECADGMFNGSFWGHLVCFYSTGQLESEIIIEGKMVNGLIDGVFYRYDWYEGTDSSDVDGDGYVQTYLTFDKGILEFVEMGFNAVAYWFAEDGGIRGYIGVDEFIEKPKEELMSRIYYIELDSPSYCKPEITKYVDGKSGVYIYPY